MNGSMTAKDLLLDQTASSHRWIEKMIDHVPAEKWGLIPAGLNTSLKWQVGHLVLSQHYHGVVVIAGPQPDLLEKLPVKAYSPYFVFGDKIGEVDERFTVEELRASLRLVQEKGLWAIGQLADGDLAGPLFPRPVPHPVATNKQEALSWNVKHNMWHCGQIGMVARAVGHPFDFKLKELTRKP
ncbi:MAG: hypothetical protein AVDCRST_MAG56-6025 [uncultured Cytophagales bacterium]|uniref:DinB-like domain-containing protein n=1 Tax=uncultured Cytophagales bacterium TaxID=158755 RepID=A0A6J4KLK8_9SPHI|nr:MAG: hypothetical protein AVDCRST_MAG56-6025 [uncultured Cytophagales bacterium]